MQIYHGPAIHPQNKIVHNQTLIGLCDEMARKVEVCNRNRVYGFGLDGKPVPPVNEEQSFDMTVDGVFNRASKLLGTFQSNQEKVILRASSIKKDDVKKLNQIEPLLQSLYFDENTLTNLQGVLDVFFKAQISGNPWPINKKIRTITHYVTCIKEHNNTINGVFNRIRERQQGNRPITSYANRTSHSLERKNILDCSEFNIHERVRDWFRARPSVFDNKNSIYSTYSPETQSEIKIAHSFPGQITEFIVQNTEMEITRSYRTAEFSCCYKAKGRIEIYDGSNKRVVEGMFSDIFDIKSRRLYHHYFAPDRESPNNSEIELTESEGLELLSERVLNREDFDRFFDYSGRFTVIKDNKKCVLDDTLAKIRYIVEL